MNYEPRSLNPSIMEKRINDLQKTSGGGGFELPIASAETLGGIKIPADSGISITGSGNAYAAKPIVYSNDETDTGAKWTDNKPIYRKTFRFIDGLVVSHSGSDTELVISGLDRFINAFGVSVGSCIPFMAFMQDGTIHLACSNDFKCYELTLEYTKTE